MSNIIIKNGYQFELLFTFLFNTKGNSIKTSTFCVQPGEERVISDDVDEISNIEVMDPIGRIREKIEFNEKKVVEKLKNNEHITISCGDY